MKTLSFILVLALVGCGPMPDYPAQASAGNSNNMPAEGCISETSSRLVTENKVGPISNLVKEEFEWGNRNECKVSFDIVVNGETHHLEGSMESYEQMDSVCYQARERARNNLLLDIGGQYKTQTVLNCRHKDQNG